MLDLLKDVVRTATDARRPLRIRAGGSKDWYGETPAAGAREVAVIDVSGHRGIVDYAPSELVVTARCGTPLAEIEQLLGEHGQMLAFEPPHCAAIARWWQAHGGAAYAPVAFGPSDGAADAASRPRDPAATARASSQATIGGCVAAGLSGPRRASAGACRDFVLGAKLLSGRGEVLAFGGRVMKNVAGYDVSRMLAGSLGVLGIVLEVSLKVLPRPPVEATLRFELPESDAIEKLNAWAGQPLPISASAWHAHADAGLTVAGGARMGTLHLRLSGAEAAVRNARARLGGEGVDAAPADAFWTGVREHTDPFFGTGLPVWRLSVPSTTPLEAFKGIARAQLIEWGGALRWFATDAEPRKLRLVAQCAGGHATLWRPAPGQARAATTFTPLDPALAAIHRRLKAEFDPAGIFNRGRLCADF